MTQLAEYPGQVAALQAAVDTGGVDGIVARLVEMVEVNSGAWGFANPSAEDVLRPMSVPGRHELVLALIAYMRGETRAGVNENLLELVTRLRRTLHLPDEVDRIELALHIAGTRWSTHDAVNLLDARKLVELGRPVPLPYVAAMRRTSQMSYHGMAKLDEMLSGLDAPLLNPGEAWADRALEDLAELGEPWAAVVAHAATATSAKMTSKFEQPGRRLLAAVGDEAARTVLTGWLSLVGRPRTQRLVRGGYEPDVNEAYDPYNTITLRGLVWLIGLLPAHDDTARLLGALVETSLRKAAGIGPRNPKIANTAVQMLARCGSEAALAQLARLSARVTYKGTLKELTTALDARAAALGLTRDEVEELAVPAYGLTEVGRRIDAFGDVRAETTVGAAGVRTTWFSAGGRPVKSPPTSVRRDHAEDLGELKAAVKDLEKMLSAQAERLDRQFLAQRVWRFAAWRERHLDHPLLGTIARRLIWTVDDQACAWAEQALTGLDGTPVVAGPDAAVRLWHPIGRPVEEVLAWRERLERDQVVQPFKQAHREVYVLTAAEENTGTYSNRYAAHVLRQHQFHALAATRGWRNKLRLMVDDEYPPATRDLPEWGLRAEYWVEGVGDGYGGDDTTETGAYLRIVTDQVRFYAIGAREHTAHASGGGYSHGWQHPPADGLPLAEIPPLVFSEIMRDVDLFVGVASVGNDPTWQDGGPEGRFQDYWNSYSFGGLSGTAQTRRDLLARIVPRLAIADRATVEDRFLVVRGDLRTYRIHLGSGNILMSPNDQYLCIVPNQSSAAGTGGVFLPFDGDRVLSVILSKAMLLARDAAITDPTITRQIHV
ncbi:DUF4132 domain-containing protein [Catellatospora sichuanensis]|uniref:DUF4132 domain-containing protein n=1 Tax=Catellatospora sichuanensis TaxID=1969805 RepID=UPI001FE28461|nr:DUF4132 domain-containing protein [Catellatospora sichuanensis]